MEWHHVTLTIDRRRHITVRLDELETSRLLDVEEGKIKMDGPLYVGGDVEKPTLGFIGCIKDVAYPNGTTVRRPNNDIRPMKSVEPDCFDHCTNEDKSKAIL